MADTVVADLVARLRVDNSEFKRGLDEAGGATQSFGQRMSAVGDKAIMSGLKMTAGLTVPLGLAGAAAFRAASDLEEAQNKVDVVFGKSADTISKWAETAAESLGMSRRAALEAAGTFGNLFRAMDISLPTATKMSKSLVTLAADLASFNNANPQEVLDALRSGLVGEIEPLRRFGVSLSQARIEAKAMELGLYNGVDAIDASAKAQAAYAIILEDTQLAQGDFARTADSAANQQRIMRAQFEDTAAALGQSLIPIFTKVAGVVQDVVKWFSSLPPAAQEIIVYAGLIVAALGPMATAFGAAMKAVSLMQTAFQALSTLAMSPWLIVAALVVGAVIGLTKAFGDGTFTMKLNAQAMDEATDAQMRNFAQTVISKFGYERFTEVVKGLAEQSTATAQRLVEAADLNRVHRDRLTEAIDREAAAQERAAVRSRDDAAAKAASTDAAYRRIQASRELTAQLAREAINAGYTPEGGFYPPGFSQGGWVGGVGNSDSVPAMLTPGEFVLSKDMLAGRAAMPAAVGAGAGGPTVIENVIVLDGLVIARNTASHLNRANGPKIRQSAVV